MSYNMRQTDGKFSIPRVKHADALAAIRQLFEHGDQHWVKVEDSKRWSTLINALADYGYRPMLDDEYNIVDLRFEAESMGADFKMFQAIAPYVDPGSFLEMCGAEGETWRWVFKDGECREVMAELVWDE